MNASNSIFRITIAHQDSLSGEQAVLLLKKLALRLESQLGTRDEPWKMDSDIWKFDWLQDSELRERAVAKTVEADMIVVAAGNEELLPQWVKDWLEAALLKKQNGPTAIVALFYENPPALTDGTATANAEPATYYLRELARLHGVDFFCNVEAAASAAPPTEAELAGFKDATDFSRDALATDRESLGWGIND
jgi:hypothetical protein